MNDQLLAQPFADLPALLTGAGMAGLLPETEGSENGHTQVPAVAGESGQRATGETTPAGSDEAPRLPAVAEAPPAGPDLTDLLSRLAGASQALADLARRDETELQAALKGLERYDAAVAAREDAEEAREQAAAVRIRAQEMATAAYSDAVRESARQVAQTASEAELQAAALAAEHGAVADSLAASEEIRRALAERLRRREAEAARQAEEARERRREDAIGTARVALAAGWLDEARRELRAVEPENPGDAEIAALLSEADARERDARVEAAERELWRALREIPRDPHAAVDRLAAVDVDGLPPELASRVFGNWARACARLCDSRGHERALRYAPARACGAVLVQDSPGAPYVVLSALGLGPRWVPGRAVDERVVRLAIPLRR